MAIDDRYDSGTMDAEIAVKKQERTIVREAQERQKVGMHRVSTAVRKYYSRIPCARRVLCAHRHTARSMSMQSSLLPCLSLSLCRQSRSLRQPYASSARIINEQARDEIWQGGFIIFIRAILRAARIFGSVPWRINVSTPYFSPRRGAFAASEGRPFRSNGRSAWPCIYRHTDPTKGCRFVPRASGCI